MRPLAQYRSLASMSSGTLRRPRILLAALALIGALGIAALRVTTLSNVGGVRQRFLGAHVARTPIAYPIFLNEYEADRQRFERSTGVDGLYSIGRNGEFAHILMEDIYWRTLRRMERVMVDGVGRGMNASHVNTDVNLPQLT